jgi:uncharacterized protein YqeY
VISTFVPTKSINMSLEKKIGKDLISAMKSRNQGELRGLRAIKSAILLFKTSGAGDILTEDGEIKILQKLIKQRKDSLEIFEKQQREDLAITEREEIEVIQRYLPKQLGRDQLEETLKQIISETGASSMKDMGRIMGKANQTLAGRADGKTIAAIVKEILGN